LKENEICQRDIPIFIAALFIIGEKWKQPMCINEQMDRENVLCSHKNYMSFMTTWMELEVIMLIQEQKDKFCMFSLV
jgi:hypothetical protein